MRKWFYAGFLLVGTIALTACNVDQSGSASQGQGQQQAAAPQGAPAAGAAQGSQGGGPNGRGRLSGFEPAGSRYAVFTG